MKNKFIELERFIAASFVLLFHLNLSKCSWIFVEFFLLLTGYFTMLHIEKNRDKIAEKEQWYPIQYTLKKFVKIFPYTMTSIVAAWVMYIIRYDFSIKEAFKWFLCLPAELLLLNGTGMVADGLPISDTFVSPIMINSHLWYVCSMLFALPVVMYLLMHMKKEKGLIITVIPLFLYGILIMKDGTVSGWHSDSFAFFFLYLRAMAGLLLGALAYYVSKWWKQRKYTTLGEILLTILEVMSFVFVGIFSYVSNIKYDALYIGLLFLSITLSNAGVTYTAKITNAKLDFLGAISLPVYCLQMPIIWLGTTWLEISNLWLVFAITLFASVVNEMVFRFIGNVYKKYAQTVRGWFVI